MDDVAGEAAEADGEFPAEEEKRTDHDKEAAEEEKCAAEFAKRVHREILPETAEKLFPPRTSVSYYLLVLTSRYVSDKYNTHLLPNDLHAGSRGELRPYLQL